jgi:hypothetical protein
VDIDLLEPLRFTFNESNEESLGLIAEDLDEIWPEIVPRDEDGNPYSIRYDLLSVLLLKGLKQLQARVKVLENKVPAT